MPKQARLSGIKAFRCYTLEEAAEASGVSPRTIRNWAADGLHVMNAERPALIRGDDLRNFIKEKRENRRTKTTPDTFYCVGCRELRKAAGGFADCTVKANRVTLTALCETCGAIVSKPIVAARIPEIARTLDLTIRRQEATL